MKSQRVTHNSRAARARRILSYSLVAVITAMVTVLLVAGTQGYSFNSDQRSLVRSGLAIVESTPDGADISIDQKSINEQTPDRVVLEEGAHNVTVQKEGYQSWSKEIRVEGNEVIWLNYPILFPEIDFRSVAVDSSSLPLAALDVVQLAPSEQRAVFAESTIEVGTIVIAEFSANGESPTIRELIYTDAVNAAGQQIENIIWSDDSRSMIIETDSDVLYLPLDRPDEMRSLSSTAGIDISAPQFKMGDRETILFLSERILRSLSLEDGSISAPIERDVVSYTQIDASNIAVLGVSSNTTAYIDHIDEDGITRVVERNDITELSDFGAWTYEEDIFIAYSSSNGFFMYKNPHITRALPDSDQLQETEITQLPPIFLSDLTISNASVLPSPSGQRVAVVSKASQLVYDIDTNDSHAHQNPSISKSNTSWLDNGYLYSAAQQDLSVWDFTGDNTTQLFKKGVQFASIDDSRENIFFVDVDTKTIYAHHLIADQKIAPSITETPVE